MERLADVAGDQTIAATVRHAVGVRFGRTADQVGAKTIAVEVELPDEILTRSVLDYEAFIADGMGLFLDDVLQERLEWEIHWRTPGGERMPMVDDLEGDEPDEWVAFREQIAREVVSRDAPEEWVVR